MQAAADERNTEHPTYGRTVLLIYNPLSGRGRAASVAERARVRFGQAGWQVARVLPTEYAGHAETTLVAEYCDTVDLIVVIGGDGTLREVVSGLIRAGSDTCLGFIPMGNANVMAREFGIPLEPGRAIEAVLSGTAVSPDAGRFESAVHGAQYFLAMVEIGQGAKIVHNVDRLRNGLLKRLYSLWGDIVYLIGGLLSFLGRKPPPFALTADHSATPQEVRQAVVSCIRMYSKGWSMTPDAVFDDGVLDLVSGERANLLLFARHMIAAVGCKPFKSRSVRYGRGTQFAIRSQHALYIQADGEAIAAADALTIETVPGAYRILVPR